MRGGGGEWQPAYEVLSQRRADREEKQLRAQRAQISPAARTSGTASSGRGTNLPDHRRIACIITRAIRQVAGYTSAPPPRTSEEVDSGEELSGAGQKGDGRQHEEGQHDQNGPHVHLNLQLQRLRARTHRGRANRAVVRARLVQHACARVCMRVCSSSGSAGAHRRLVVLDDLLLVGACTTGAEQRGAAGGAMHTDESVEHQRDEEQHQAEVARLVVVAVLLLSLLRTHERTHAHDQRTAHMRRGNTADSREGAPKGHPVAARQTKRIHILTEKPTKR